MGKNTTAAGVSIITCTNRPQYFNHILHNFQRQHDLLKELIIIINNDQMNLADYRLRARKVANVRVYQVNEKTSLGQCLNCGIAKCKFPYIAKFDDDDYYSAFYLKEQLKALRLTKSDVVGKHACLVYLAAAHKLLIRSPHERNKEVNFVQGATILFHRRVLKKVQFPDRSLGEDVAFLRACNQHGFKTFATTPFNYVYIRRKNKQSHTWRVKDDFYLNGSQLLSLTRNFRSIAKLKV
ncbi:glycosyltransferase family 2 protein [Paenibacillus sp. CGMCC 1.16610]|uniref:Glycosyltransferase n=1 Tax=Paenibacillus anseongense TaxID=2682845 RepID=A0ABW9UKN8_9BACL|nr:MULTISPECIES: glycosyltransferase [Paenibacillus]MBA2941097.1 glycosyltransferase family 2 protein [Paenibacillus sp. CGMCC 1.16610]MVQ39916.1 glycosyltransferase [Paenibacillus anseongense]